MEIVLMLEMLLGESLHIQNTVKKSYIIQGNMLLKTEK